MRGTSSETRSGRHGLRVVRALRQIIYAVDLHSRRLSAEHKLTAPQLDCLLTIEEHQPVTASAIARSVHLSPSTVVGVLDRLEVKGLVLRERGAKDRRLVWLSLTDQGRSLVESAPSSLQKTLAEAMRELSEETTTAIAESLERIVELMEIRDFGPAATPESAPQASPDLATAKPAELAQGQGVRRNKKPV